MVELVDTLVSGTSGLKAVQVRVLSWVRWKAGRPAQVGRLFFLRASGSGEGALSERPEDNFFA